MDPSERETKNELYNDRIGQTKQSSEHVMFAWKQSRVSQTSPFLCHLKQMKYEAAAAAALVFSWCGFVVVGRKTKG